MACKVFRSCSDGDFGLVYFDADFTPLSKRVKVDSSLNQILCKLFSSGFEGICSDGERSLSFISFEKLNQFSWVHEGKKVID